MKIIIFALITSGILFTGCKKDEKSNQPGEVKFSLNIKSNPGIKTALIDPNVGYLLISIEKTDGTKVYDQQKVDLIKFSDNYISKSISLKTGDYRLTFFQVLDNNGTVLYATPFEGKPQAYLVNDPLNIDFSVAADHVTTLSPEVISTVNIPASDFGYLTFTINEVKTIDVLLGIYVYNTTSKNFQLTDASLTVSDGTKDLYSFSLAAITNHIIVTDGLSSYTFKVSKSGYQTAVSSFTPDELKASFQKPLTIRLLPDLTQGLIAYYPFNGNANDESGNGRNGTVKGAILSTDRNGNSNSAYSFDGSASYISLPYSGLNVNEFTYSAWFKINQLPPDYYLYAYQILCIGGDYGNLYMCYTTANGVSEFQFTDATVPASNPFSCLYPIDLQLNTWYNLVCTYTNSQAKMYLNGNLVSSSTPQRALDYGSANYKATIGSRLNQTQIFDGSIDEVRIYNYALTQTEVTNLYNSK